LIGAYVCGDAIDANEQYIVAGCWRTERQLQLWDIASLQPYRTIPWATASGEIQAEVCTAKFIPDSPYFVAGGSRVAQLKMFSVDECAQVGSPVFLDSHPLCISISTAPPAVIVVTADGKLQFLPVSLKDSEA
jgi:hypothetical protein